MRAMSNRLMIILASTMFWANTAFAQTALKVVSSTISFKIKNAGLGVTGTFTGLEADIKFSPDNFRASTIKASVDVNTINTEINARDKHLKKEEFFDVAQFPKITIVSNFFGKETNGFKGYFKLTIKGITKDIVIPFIFDNNTFTGQFTINRRDFNIGGSSIMMSDNVLISLTIKTAPQN
jgi:polyisoprenoid-binding protein YceI